jgi:hypothetical protein
MEKSDLPKTDLNPNQCRGQCMASTFAPSEQGFDRVDPKTPATKDGAVAIAAQDAYKIGTKIDSSNALKDHLGPASVTMDMPPLWTHPASDSNSMSSSNPGGKDDGWKPYEALNLNVKKVPIDAAQPNNNNMGDKGGWTPDEAVNPAKKMAPFINAPMSNSNAMDGREKGATKGTDNSGWSAYEAIDLGSKPIAKPHAIGEKK